jgi:hypothetical protein
MAGGGGRVVWADLGDGERLVLVPTSTGGLRWERYAESFPEPPPRAGVWFVFTTDYHELPVAVFDDELLARRFAQHGGCDSVTFWPFGVEWRDHRKTLYG